MAKQKSKKPAKRTREQTPPAPNTGSAAPETTSTSQMLSRGAERAERLAIGREILAAVGEREETFFRNPTNDDSLYGPSPPARATVKKWENEAILDYSSCHNIEEDNATFAVQLATLERFLAKFAPALSEALRSGYLPLTKNSLRKLAGLCTDAGNHDDIMDRLNCILAEHV